ncbi:MAG: hypothetical protein ACJAZN_001531 [Planctomycetota bacterium]|jgi:hypothetical protein
MSRDYVDLKVDTDRHRNGAAVAKALRGDRQGGIPWIVVTDADGVELITGDGPNGNIGCPVTEAERAHFIEMVKVSSERITEAELKTLTDELAAFAATIR